MELRQLRYFHALTQYRHFGRAAQFLHITQPSLSQQIKALETKLGVKLFDRSRRHVALTPDGEALLPYARRILTLAADAEAEMADRQNLLHGRIRLGTIPTLGGYLLPRLLRGFHQAHPGLDLTITEDGSDRLGTALTEGSLDLALLVDDGGREGRTFEFLLKERILAALPANHALSSRQAVALDALRHESFILCREGYHLRGLTLEACQEAGFEPRVSVSGTDVDTALRFVRAGLGVTLIPEFVADSQPGIAALDLDPPSLFRTVGMSWNPNRYFSRAASALLDFLRTASKKPERLP